MKIFGISSSNSLEVEIEKATSEKNINEKWGLIMEICDKIGTSSVNAKDSLRIIMKRLAHPDPHVVVQAITLLDACVNNCGKNYHLEIASREFEQEYRKLIQKSQPPIANKLKTCLKKWAENDFKKDPQLNLIPSLYNKMKQEGHSFSDTESTPKREVELSKDPNVVSSQQEEDDIAKAIELSLKEKTGSPKAQGSSYPSSLYPSMNVSTPATTGVGGSAPALVEPRKVRALYDFEAAEDNELTFKAGEIIMVLEESDPNWWRGTNHRGEGFFPANFVTADLSAEPEDLSKDIKSSKRVEQYNSDQQNIHNLPVEINEDSIDRLLFLLHEADPSDPSQDSDEMLRLENVVNQMGPLIDSELERVDRKHAQLTQLSSDLIDTINLYHSLMRETERAPALGMYSNFTQAHPQQMYSPLGFPPNSAEQYRMSATNMIPARGMMMVPGQGMVYPASTALPHGNFQMPAQSAGRFQPSQPNQMIPPVPPQQNMPSMNHHMTNGMVQNLQQSGNLQQMPRQMMHSDGMVPQGPLMTGTAIQQQAPAPHYPQHQQQLPQPPQQNGFPQTNFQPMALPHPSMQQQIENIGNLSLQPPPVSMMNMNQVAQQSQITQITQPMTYNLQADSNQNIPMYQQR